ncbi:Lipid-binding serum glycoprotein, C-terminal domain and Bactericidal permeability-increasing protein, alpha/beta domain-containing protein [Strongyloides ratti]|uniref:Lipid-binding serum glycoprotein, C-terminal domain and Bactericidal permeability-increasing protein, alpha/beta domain-containing protein n=1 Tax=Strongyloides ratti TaxID=34506 RepID=A0A090L2K9_STRRB|nr:Lipid-binding serum glycoprotein, C-terminal domain and Bactericidal permeability-increasing protein, alpha/beta domain-containing protein [Strongyloides ratti]CEF62337.1 Lipid-binding serum glycoprotein, C-terminal domain and Bactericidal permeability-increasing protein, alpha/beta domain-containing protein [Strongyloides ratti]
MTSLAEDGIPKIFDHFALPNIETDAAKITDLFIINFDKPKIKTKFMDKFGIDVELKIPLVSIHGDITVDLFIVTYKGTFNLELKNLEILMDVKISKELNANETNINVTRCEITKNFANIVFFGEDSTNLLGVKDVIIKNVEEKVTNTVCGLAYMIKGFLDEQSINATIKRERSMIKNDNSDEESFQDSLCSINDIEEENIMINDNVDDDNKTNPFKPSDWGVDISLRYPPTFSNKDVIFGIDGGILYLGDSASNVTRPKTLNISIPKDQMISFIITDYVPNTFFEHIHNNGFLVFEEYITSRNSPKYMRKMLETFCKTCKLVLSANLTKKPEIKITKRGILLKLSGNFGVYFSRNDERNDILSSDISFETTIRPHIRHSRIFGEVSLTAVEININSIGMNGMLANGIRKVLNFMIPKTIWPTLKKRLRFAINKRGIKLPVICGVELEKLHVDYQDHTTIISSDFSFDLPHFLRAFKRYMKNRVQQKIKRNQKFDDIATFSSTSSAPIFNFDTEIQKLMIFPPFKWSIIL